MSENTGFELPSDGGGWPKLVVKDFGPIAEGKVELRPLTVFAGPSNTGKSWLAMLIYAMTRHVNGDDLRGFGSRIEFGRNYPDENVLENFPENPAAWLRSLRKDKMLRLTDEEQQTLKSMLEREQESLKEEILRCFGLAETRHLVRNGRAGTASVTFMNATPPDLFATRQSLTVAKKGGFSLDVDVMTNECRAPPTEHFMDALIHLDANLDDEPDKDFLLHLREDLLYLLVNNPRHLSTHYLPAGRGGIMHTHRVVVSALIQNASRAGLNRNSSLPILSGVLADFLAQMLELTDRVPRRRAPRRPAAEPAVSLERNVLGGKIQVERSPTIDYPHFTYRPDKWKRDLSLMSASSMVLELAPIVLYLRHCVRKGDFLILEEPEAHLHPAMQVRLVHEIAGWVRQGIRVLITTHSEWVLEEIANLVAAGESEKEDGLGKQDVGMWLFEPNGKQTPGSNIRKIEWSIDEGGYASDFDEVAMALHNDWATLVGEEE